MKRYNLLMALIASFLIVNGLYACTPALNSAFCNLTNYRDYANITVRSWNGTYPFSSSVNTMIGSQNYVYVNTTFNTSLGNSPIGRLSIEGYKNGHFVGNITALPYPIGKGLLIDNLTIYGTTYSTAVIWFNQILTNNTYLNNYAINNVKIQRYSGDPINLYIYNTSFINGVSTSSKLLNPSTLTFAGQYDTYFNLTGGYILLSQNQTASYWLNNQTLSADIGYGSFSYAVTSVNSIQTLSTHGVFISSLKSFNYNGIEIYLNGRPAQRIFGCSYPIIVTNSLQLNDTCYEAINSSTSFYPNPFNYGFYFNGRQFYLQMNYTNQSSVLSILPQFSTRQTYYLIPAYTSNIIHTTVSVANPTSPSNSNGFDTVMGWYLDSEFRIPININTWNFTFNTYAYSNGNTLYLNKSHIYKIPNAPYLLLNITHYNTMGLNCQNIYIRDYNNNTGFDYGTIPFAVVNCNSNNTIASLILRNTTSLGYTYNSFFLYFGSRLGDNWFVNNQSIINKWQTIYSNGTGSPQSLPQNSVLFKYTSPLNLRSFINIQANSGTYSNFLNATGQSNDYTLMKNRYEYSGGPNLNIQMESLPQNIFAINITSGSIIGTYGSGYSDAEGGAESILANLTNITANPPLLESSTINLVVNVSRFNTLTIQKIFTNNFSLGAVQYYPTLSNNLTGLPNVPPQSITTPINETVVNDTANSILNAKVELASMGLDNLIVFYGLSFPLYYFSIFAIVAILAIASMIDAYEHEGAEIPAIIFLMVLWLIGLLVWQELILAIVITLIIGVYYIEHRKG